MCKQRLLTISQVVSFLAVLTVVTSDDSFLVNDIDYGSLYSSNLKEKCSDYPEFRPCHYWKTFVEEASDGDKVPKNQDNCTSQTKDCPEILLEVPFLSPERILEKRFTVFRRKNPYAQGYKRGPGFRSWGGKRGQPEKRTKFTSWGGKRDGFWDNNLEEDESEEKRTKFGNWGGKREGYEDKRAKFRSWGGKRSEDYVEGREKKDPETPIAYDQMEKKTWNNHGMMYLSEPLKKHVPKRPQFQSWGGKRTPRPWVDFLGVYYPNFKKFGGEKRKFSSWGGKRDVDGNLNKRYDPNNNAGKIATKFKTPQIFQNWGGKRESQEDEEIRHVLEFVTDDEREKIQNEKRSNFNSWGGKRGEGKETGEGLRR